MYLDVGREAVFSCEATDSPQRVPTEKEERPEFLPTGQTSSQQRPTDLPSRDLGDERAAPRLPSTGQMLSSLNTTRTVS